MEFGLDVINIILVFTSIGYILRVVWHTEGALDKSYRAFLFFAIVFGFGVVFDMFSTLGIVPRFTAYRAFKALAYVFFVFGVMEMNRVIVHQRKDPLPKSKKR